MHFSLLMSLLWTFSTSWVLYTNLTPLLRAQEETGLV